VDTWDEDTPSKRVEVTVKADLEYLNGALENSEIPIRYVTWGSVQDIGRTDAEIGQKDYLEVFDEYVFSILRNPRVASVSISTLY
jgi:hypothetical protein